uniref:Uncharacterized protein n=1 Tax=Chlorocebus sabaeus TaxID=60711 RepID=A0A0D9RNM4_CHLSB
MCTAWHCFHLPLEMKVQKPWEEPDETPGLTEGGRESYEEGILKNLLLGREDGKLSQSAVLHPIPQPHMPAHSRDLPTLLGKASELLPQDVL